MFAGNQEEEMKGKNEIKNKRTECWRNTREKIFYERRGELPVMSQESFMRLTTSKVKVNQ